MLHKHHIVPKHLDGPNTANNIVYLTIEEHAEAHRKLFEEHGRWQDELAWKGLSGQINNDDIIKQRIVLANKGKKKSLEQREKMRISHLGSQNGKGNLGKPKSEEHKRNISEALKAKNKAKRLASIF